MFEKIKYNESIKENRKGNLGGDEEENRRKQRRIRFENLKLFCKYYYGKSKIKEKEIKKL